MPAITPSAWQQAYFAEAARIMKWFESRPDHPRAYAEVLIHRHWQLIDRIVEGGSNG